MSSDARIRRSAQDGRFLAMHLVGHVLTQSRGHAPWVDRETLDTVFAMVDVTNSQSLDLQVDQLKDSRLISP